MDIKGVFNDFYLLLSGKRQTGLLELMEKHKEDPLFFLLLDNLDAVPDEKVMDAMQEAYGLRGRLYPACGEREKSDPVFA